MTSGPPLPADFCPYVGLAPYTESHSDFFFGRERDQKLVISNLYAMPMTVLYGASGVGKTSVLLAWIVPQLKRTHEVDFVMFRQWQDAEFMSTLKKEVLSTVINRIKAQDDPGLHHEHEEGSEASDPNVESSENARGNKKLLEERKARLGARQVLESLETGKSSLEDLSLDELLRHCTLVSQRPFFIILDQFEEYFLYNPPSKASDSFDAELARVVNRKDLSVKFLLSMRQEDLGKLARFRGRIPNMLSNLVFLEHLDDEGAKAAILKPLEVFNSRVPDSRKVTIETELVEALIQKSREASDREEAKGRIAGEMSPERPIKTPVLQMLLTSLWDAEKKANSQILRVSTLEQLGGVENVMRTYLDRVMNEIEEPQLGTAAEIFRYLVTPSGTKIAQTLPDLVSSTRRPMNEVGQTLDTLLTSPVMHILRKVSIPGQEERYEIVHDALGTPISDWRRRYQIRLDEKAEAERRQQEKRAQRRRLGVFALVIAVISMLGVTVYALSQRRSAIVARVQAEKATADFILQQKETSRQKEETERQRQKVTEERDQAERQKAQFELEAKLAKAEEEKKIALAKRDEAERQRARVMKAEADKALAEIAKLRAEQERAEAVSVAEVNEEKIEELNATIDKSSTGTVSLNPNPTESLGIDISHHNGSVDWQKVKDAGVSFVFFKATQGIKTKDKRFDANSQGAREAGIPQGAYHFFVPTIDGEQQANFFLETVGSKSDLPAVLDVEPMKRINASPTVVMREMRKWLQVVEQRTGCRPIIYTTSRFAQQFISSKEFGRYHLWIGHYDQSPPPVPDAWTDWKIWQYTFKGSVNGISGTVDLNRIRGSDLNLLLCKPKR